MHLKSETVNVECCNCDDSSALHIKQSRIIEPPEVPYLRPTVMLVCLIDFPRSSSLVHVSLIFLWEQTDFNCTIEKIHVQNVCFRSSVSAEISRK